MTSGHSWRIDQTSNARLSCDLFGQGGKRIQILLCLFDETKDLLNFVQWLKKVKIWSLKLNLLPFSCTFLYFTLFYNISAVIDSLDKKTHFNLLLLLVFFFCFSRSNCFCNIFANQAAANKSTKKLVWSVFPALLKIPPMLLRFLPDSFQTSDFFIEKSRQVIFFHFPAYPLSSVRPLLPSFPHPLAFTSGAR